MGIIMAGYQNVLGSLSIIARFCGYILRLL